MSASHLPGLESARTLIDDLLAEQHQLTAVERFSRNHTASEFPAQARYYRDLVPLAKPRPGEQYAFAVDLDLCTGCKACVSACHSLNGLDDHETWRSVELLHGGTVAAPYQQTVTAACHHCLDPACLNGCPVLAYEKDPHTGIVRHLDDQCIGCQYCVLKCPYDVPKYSARRGIVRKCDMCHSRLETGEAPACVQACPSSAISIQLASKVETARLCSTPGTRLVPDAFESNYTQPTTTYFSRRPLPINARIIDSGEQHLEPAHWPLVWMLLLTQAAAGFFLSIWLTSLFSQAAFAPAKSALAICGFVLLQIGLAASVLHLGRPLGAWRAFLGLRRSWMSREIAAFCLFALAAGTFAVCGFANRLAASSQFLIGTTALLGLFSVFCSAMIYVDTRRPSWAPALTFPRFFGATLLLGASGASLVLCWLAVSGGVALREAAQANAWAATVIRTALFACESQVLLRALKDPSRSASGAALLSWRCSKSLLFARAGLFVVANALGVVGIFWSGLPGFWCATSAFLATFASQIIERYLFFTTARATNAGRFSE